MVWPQQCTAMHKHKPLVVTSKCRCWNSLHLLIQRPWMHAVTTSTTGWHPLMVIQWCGSLWPFHLFCYYN